jgi:hypothetical protein
MEVSQGLHTKPTLDNIILSFHSVKSSFLIWFWSTKDLCLHFVSYHKVNFSHVQISAPTSLASKRTRDSLITF